MPAMQVALTFLVQYEVPSEPVWAAFIAAAAELTLRAAVPPTQPSPPGLLPKIPALGSNTTCEPSWDGGGMFSRHAYSGPLRTHTPRPPPSGAVPRAAGQRACMCSEIRESRDVREFWPLHGRAQKQPTCMATESGVPQRTSMCPAGGEVPLM